MGKILKKWKITKNNGSKYLYYGGFDADKNAYLIVKGHLAPGLFQFQLNCSSVIRDKTNSCFFLFLDILNGFSDEIDQKFCFEKVIIRDKTVLGVQNLIYIT